MYESERLDKLKQGKPVYYALVLLESLGMKKKVLKELGWSNVGKQENISQA